MSRKRIVGTCVTAIISLVWLSAPVGADDPLRVTTGEVSVLCPLTIGGDFEAKTKSLSGDVAVASPQSVKGELIVDLRTLDTGISLRNRHLRSNYLEVEKGPTFSAARLRDIRVERLEGKTTFRGTLTLHGESREVSGTANIVPNGGSYRLEASFPVRISEFKIPEPTYLGVGVKDEVVVRVNLSAAPATTVASNSKQ
jgi:polyisoprenoid-binding protein YceI